MEKLISLIVAEYSNLYKSASTRLTGSAAYHFSHTIPELEDYFLYMRCLTGRQKQWSKTVLVIANIVVPEELCGKGFFKQLISATMKLCADQDWVLQVENVLNPRLYDYLVRKGFDPQPHDYKSLFWAHDKSIFDTRRILWHGN